MMQAPAGLAHLQMIKLHDPPPARPVPITDTYLLHTPLHPKYWLVRPRSQPGVMLGEIRSSSSASESRIGVEEFEIYRYQ